MKIRINIGLTNYKFEHFLNTENETEAKDFVSNIMSNVRNREHIYIGNAIVNPDAFQYISYDFIQEQPEISVE